MNYHRRGHRLIVVAIFAAIAAGAAALAELAYLAARWWWH